MNTDTFESLARELAATTKRLAPALARKRTENKADETLSRQIAPTLAKVLQRSNELANHGVPGFTHFEDFTDLMDDARELDREQRGARSGPARILWEGSWSGNDAERARTLCIFLQKMEKNAPPRTRRPKRDTRKMSPREKELLDRSVRAAVDVVVREGRFSHTAVHKTAVQIHKRLAKNGERPPTRPYVSGHSAYVKVRDDTRPQVPRPPIGVSRREQEANRRSELLRRVIAVGLFANEGDAERAYEENPDKVLQGLAAVSASNLPKHE